MHNFLLMNPLQEEESSEALHTINNIMHNSISSKRSCKISSSIC